MERQNSPSVLYRDESIVVAVKPAGMPSEPDPTGDPDMRSLLSRGEPALFSVHRLDRVTGGVMVFARTKRAASVLSRAIASGEEGTGRDFTKVYFAIVAGEIRERFSRTDYLTRDPRLGRAKVVTKETAGARRATLAAVPLAYATVEGTPATLLAVKLETGRFHQIRAQLSNAGHSIVGDGKYGSRVRCPLALFAGYLSFSHPAHGEKVSFSCLPPREKPWTAFDTLTENKIAEELPFLFS